MASTARIDELKKKFDENPRRYFAPLANEFRKAGDIEQAIMICEEFLPQQPGHMSGHIVYGQALYEAGKVTESRTVFETALGLDPENLIALRHLGDIAHGQGDHPAARNWYVRVLDADPRNEEIRALIASVDVENPQVEAEAPVVFDVPGSGMGFEIEKEVSPFEQEMAPPAEEMNPTPRAVANIDPALAVTAPLGVAVIPARSMVMPPSDAPALLEGFSGHGFDTPSIDDADGPGHHAAAEGLESTAFTPPDEQVDSADLDDSLESGVPSFSAPVDDVQSVAGLQGSGGHDHAQLDASAPPANPAEATPLDLDDGLVLPPQGDALAAEASSADAPLAMDAEGMDAAGEFAAFENHDDGAPVEPPPEPSAFEMELADEPVARPPFVTETMAELYVAQGFPEQARAVYEQLFAANPGDERLRALVASHTPSVVPHDDGPNVREFLARLAGRRPGARTAAAIPPSDDDFAPMDPSETVAAADGPPEEAPYSVMEAEAEVQADAHYEADAAIVPVAEEAMAAVATTVAPAIERAAAMRTPTGSIDAMFGNRPAGTSEDSAAAALAQAFGGEPAAPSVIAGRPARAATGELSLDSVFRDGPARPPRTSQSFSFDQFFSGSAERVSGSTPQRTSAELAIPGEAPAERSADDIDQFNSWLQGLKPR